MDKKWIIIIVLSLTTLIFAYIAFKPSEIIFNSTLSKRVEDSLVSRINALKINNDVLDKKNKVIEAKNDSLQSLKPQIVIKYNKIYESIDRASGYVLVNKFDSLFRSVGIN